MAVGQKKRIDFSMNIFKIQTTKDIDKISSFISNIINKKLQGGRKVLLFLSGGSFVPIEVEISKKIKEEHSSNLTITLADERFGCVGHPDSNWFHLQESGFEIKNAEIIPILQGENIKETSDKFENTLNSEFKKADYKLALLGIGADGHTAGILPSSDALRSSGLVCFYNTELYNRITVTPSAISLLDEVIVYANGKEKWTAIENLYKDIDIALEPAQILKKVPLLTIFTDYIKKI